MASAEDFGSLSSVPCSVRWQLVPPPPPEACEWRDEGARDQACSPRACFPQEGWPRDRAEPGCCLCLLEWLFFLTLYGLSGSSSVISLVILWFLRWKTNDLEAMRQVDVAGGASVSPLSQRLLRKRLVCLMTRHWPAALTWNSFSAGSRGTWMPLGV